MNKKYTTILFDLDGTIANTDEMIVQTFLKLYDLYGHKDRPSIEKILYFSGPPIKETLKNEFPEVDQKVIYDQFHDISWELYESHVSLYPYVTETLIKLKSKNYRLGIVTNKLHKTTLRCLSFLHIDHFFDVFICADDVVKAKPHQEGIIKAMNLLNEKDVSKVIYIGDNESDYFTSLNAQVDSILVTWGPRKISSLIKPTYFIDSFNELLELL